MMLRTASGLVACTPYIRTASGLVECDRLTLFGVSGPIDAGSGAILTVVASPEFVYGTVDSGASTTAVTNAATVSVTGGKPPYTYAWDGDATLAIDAPTSATTTFSAAVGPSESSAGAYSCTVTDAAGHTTESNAISASVENYRGDYGGL